MKCGGVWELTAINRMPIGAGDKYALGDTGGEETHTLTLEEVPAHTHSTNISSGTGGSISAGQVSWGNNRIANYYTTNTLGGGKAHNNMPPYQAFYIWKRIA